MYTENARQKNTATGKPEDTPLNTRSKTAGNGAGLRSSWAGPGCSCRSRRHPADYRARLRPSTAFGAGAHLVRGTCGERLPRLRKRRRARRLLALRIGTRRLY